ncbi:MAG: carbohydrate-binding protein [Peptococcaceae bacterium MAG4]|nr:carbohydrate-binding protein [Peptococcaceae bacterium MAG4]
MKKLVTSWKDTQKGVEVRGTYGNEVTIIYNGLLKNSGADQVYLHYGYGDTDRWYDINTIRMDNTHQGFEKTISMKNHMLNFCFKDSANNWDNNNGHNWTVR